MNCCNSCGDQNIEKISDKEYYCPNCDVTYTVDKGKKVKPQPHNRITQLETTVESMGAVIKNIAETLKPKEGVQGFDWGKKDGE